LISFVRIGTVVVRDVCSLKGPKEGTLMPNIRVKNYPALFKKFAAQFAEFKAINRRPAEGGEPDDSFGGQCEDMPTHEEMLVKLLEVCVLGDPEKERQFLAIIWDDILDALHKKVGVHEHEIELFLDKLFLSKTPEEFFNGLF